MFCVLNVRSRENTFFERVFGCFIKDDYSIKTIPVLKCAPFFWLDATVGKNGVDWEAVEGMAGKCSRRLLLSGDIELPPNENIGIFKSDMLYKKLMQNTISEILKNNCQKKHPLRICLSDTKGEFASFAADVARYAEKLTVVTQNKAKYEKICSEIMEDTGLSVVLSSSVKYEKIFIDLDEMLMSVNLKNGVLKFSGGEDFSVPPIYEGLLPHGINKYDFYSALYELCGAFSIGECIFDTIFVNNEKKNVQTVHFS